MRSAVSFSQTNTSGTTGFVEAATTGRATRRDIWNSFESLGVTVGWVSLGRSLGVLHLATRVWVAFPHKTQSFSRRGWDHSPDPRYVEKRDAHTRRTGAGATVLVTATRAARGTHTGVNSFFPLRTQIRILRLALGRVLLR